MPFKVPGDKNTQSQPNNQYIKLRFQKVHEVIKVSSETDLFDTLTLYAFDFDSNHVRVIAIIYAEREQVISIFIAEFRMQNESCWVIETQMLLWCLNHFRFNGITVKNLNNRLWSTKARRNKILVF